MHRGGLTGIRTQSNVRLQPTTPCYVCVSIYREVKSLLAYNANVSSTAIRLILLKTLNKNFFFF